MTDHDGNTYLTVAIGDQVWMAENLKSLHDAEGRPIPDVFVYDQDEAYLLLYGRLYSWTSAMNGDLPRWAHPGGIQGICPAGWHLPNAEEWQQLVKTLTALQQGPAGNLLKSCRQAGSPLGGDCATTDHPRWDFHDTHFGTDELGFSALPGGIRIPHGEYVFTGRMASWWVPIEQNDEMAFDRSLFNYLGVLATGVLDKEYALSVRCVRNAPASGVPEVETLPATDITMNGAILGGAVRAEGDGPVFDRGLYISEEANPSVTGIILMAGSGSGGYSGFHVGLTPGTTYHIQAFATNTHGTAYGRELQFMTRRDEVPSPVPCPTEPLVTDADGNAYPTVLIGGQCWLKENLRTTTYLQGDPIPTGHSPAQWMGLRTGAYALPDSSRAMGQHYGLLYNWHAVKDSRGLCPPGWRVPGDQDWIRLEVHAGMDPEEAERISPLRGEGIARFLKSERQILSPLGGKADTYEHPRWLPSYSAYGTDYFGFSGVPSGWRDQAFAPPGDVLWLWTSTPSGVQGRAMDRYMELESDGIGRYHASQAMGLSVRCVREAPGPAIKTSSIREITATTALAGISVTHDGGSPVFDKGFYWGREPGPEHHGTRVSGGSGTGSFNHRLTGLTPGNRYYVTGYATNDTGTVTGNEISFVAGVDLFTITAESDAYGFIEPSGQVRVRPGDDVEFIMTPLFGHSLHEVIVDGESVGVADRYVFTNVGRDHHILALFAPPATGLSRPKEEIRLYPNPARGPVVIQTPLPAILLRVLDLYGRELLLLDLSQQPPPYRVDVSALPAGLALFEITGRGFRQVSKVMIQH
jgi:uncharacterized protein (TIGR02145 family)